MLTVLLAVRVTFETDIGILLESTLILPQSCRTTRVDMLARDSEWGEVVWLQLLPDEAKNLEREIVQGHLESC